MMKRFFCIITALTILGLSWAAIGSAEETGAAQILTAEETGAAQILTAEEDARMHAAKQQRIDEILSAATDIRKADEWIPGETYTGTAYYVSPEGDDGNDGLTPETPKKTMEWLNGAVNGEPDSLQPGDAVFLERGGIYRVDPSGLGMLCWMSEGVTLSAYGEGDKPIMTASPENGTGAENWIPVYEDESGKKIWQYARNLPDIGSVILNNGEGYAARVYEFWNGNGYESCEAEYYLMEFSKGMVLKGELLPLENSLEEDLRIISRPDLTGMESEYMDSTRKGPLYLRCDAGNPGELYASVEFCPVNMCGIVWLMGSRNVFDNISFRCGGTAYIKNGRKAAGADGKEPSGAEMQGTIIQNCEFAFGGGAAVRYCGTEDADACVCVQGDGVYCVTNNTVFRNNYCRDAACTSFGFEGDLALDPDEGPKGMVEILNNVIEGTFALRLDTTAECMRYIKSVNVRGNLIWDTGRIDAGNYYYAEGSIFCMCPFYGEYIVQDNLFYCSEKGSYGNALIRGYDADAWGSAPIYTGNTYVQHSARKLANLGNVDIYINDPQLKEKAARFLGDADGTFRMIEDDVPDSAPMVQTYYEELPPETDIPAEPGSEINDADRAAELGLPLNKMEQESVNGTEMMALLDHLVAAAAPEKAEEWKGMHAQLRGHAQPLTRFDAMGMMYLAAQFIGGDYLAHDNGEVAYAVARLQFPFDHYYFTEGLFEGIDGPYFSVPVLGEGFYLDAASLFFNLWRQVPGRNVYPFDYDEENNSVREFDPPTYAEAVSAVARLSLIGGLAGER